MKTLLAIVLLCAGCEAKLSVVSEPTVSNVVSELYTTNYWVKYYGIWKCDDGTFEVKSRQFVIAKTATLEEARDRRLERAAYMAEYSKQNSQTPALPTLPDCGKRIE